MPHMKIAFARIELLLEMEIIQQFHDDQIDLLEATITEMIKQTCTKSRAREILSYIEIARKFSVLDKEELEKMQEFLELIVKRNV